MANRYAPPPLDTAWLLASLKDMFPSHNEHPRTIELLQQLVHAYSMWWVLMVTFRERRIVGTAPLWIVRRIHSSEIERFFADCFDYLGRIPRKEDMWGGALDFRGTHDTARSIHELFDYPDLVWEPILQTAEKQRNETIVRIN